MARHRGEQGEVDQGGSSFQWVNRLAEAEGDIINPTNLVFLKHGGG